MKERQRRSIIVGVFVIVGIFLFIFAIYLIGQKEYVFGKPVSVNAVFADVKGLQEGDKVRMSGIDIGTVSSLGFVRNNQVLVQLNIDKEQFTYITKGSQVLIGSEGLMGAKVVQIIPSEIQGDHIVENDTLGTIAQIEVDEVLRQVSSASANLTVLTEELVTMSQKINSGEGVLGKLLNDNSMNRSLDQVLANIKEMTGNFQEVSEKLDKGRASDNINAAASNLKDITERINRGEGTIGQLLTDTSLISSFYRSSINLQETTANLSKMTAALNNDSSALNLLIDDPSFADSLEVVIENLNTGVIEATKAAEAVQKSGLIRLGSKKKRKD